MVRIPKASLDFKIEAPGEKIITGNKVTSALTLAAAGTNPFKSLPVSIADIQAATDALVTTGTAAATGNFSDISKHEDAVKDWDQKMTVTANFVSTVAEISASPADTIILAGFVPTKDYTTPHPLPPASDSFVVYNNGKKKAIVAENKTKINFTRGYVFAGLPEGAEVEFDDDVMQITMGGLTCYIAVTTKRKIELFKMPKTPLTMFTYGFNAAGSGPASKAQDITPGSLG